MMMHCLLIFILFASPILVSSILSAEESHNGRLWIYSEIYSTSVCSYSSSEYAFGVSTHSCVTHSPFFEFFFEFFPLVKSFKIEGTECSSTRLRLYEDSTCNEEDAVPRYIEDQLWDAIVNTIGQCKPVTDKPVTDIRFTEPRYHSRLMCVPSVDDKIPTLNFNSFIASGYPDNGVNVQQESCLTDMIPSTFAAIPSDNCDSNIPPHLVPSFPAVLTTQKSAYNFDCTNSEALGYATEYQYLDEDICVGTGANKKIPLNVCKLEQLLNPLSESESERPQLLQRRQLQEDIEVESSLFLNLVGYDTVAMQNVSINGEMNINATIMMNLTALNNLSHFHSHSIPHFDAKSMMNISHFIHNNNSIYNFENITHYNAQNISHFHMDNITHFHADNFSHFHMVNVSHFNVENFTQYWHMNVTEMENSTYFQNTSFSANITAPPTEFNYTNVYNYTMFNNITTNVTMFENLTFNSNVTHYLNGSELESHQHYINVTEPKYYYYVKYSCAKGNQSKPVASPTRIPTLKPTVIQTSTPSVEPSTSPSEAPSVEPSTSPSEAPSVEPSTSPSEAPSVEPSTSPSEAPSVVPSTSPTVAPSVAPSTSPTVAPSVAPSTSPSEAPSVVPSTTPSEAPSASPTLAPSQVPSFSPSYRPTCLPTIEPTYDPTQAPSHEPSVTPTEEPTLKAGETRAPIRTPTARPTATPSFQTFPVINFASKRDMSLDATSANAVTSDSPDVTAVKIRSAMCATQLKSQGLGSDAICSLKGTATQRRLSMQSVLTELFGFSKGSEDESLLNHFRGEAENTPVTIDFNSQINMVNHQGTPLADLLGTIVASSKAFSPKNFTQTLKKQAKSAGVTSLAISGVGPSEVKANSFVVAAPPTFSPTTIPTSATPTIASPTYAASAVPSKSLSSPIGGGSSSGGGLTTGAIIGISVGGAVLIILVVLGVVYHMYRTKRQKVYADQ